MTDRRTYTGHVAAPGIALGVVHRTDRPPTRTALPHRAGGDPTEQITDAFDAVAARLLDLSTSLRAQGKDEQADIMEVNSYIAQDQDLREQAVKRANDGQPVPVAVRQAIDAYAGTIAALDDPTLAERAADVRQVGRRVLAHLHGETGPTPDQPLVLVAHEIGAADLLEPGLTVTAAISVTGGPNSHAAIVARALGILLLLGVDPSCSNCRTGTRSCSTPTRPARSPTPTTRNAPAPCEPWRPPELAGSPSPKSATCPPRRSTSTASCYGPTWPPRPRRGRP
ncbi:PEP-utilizing enzyme [Streptomyces diastatochromogenes]|nr:PEP-utilizing enzyme [Streptomyces diastatochromogenes]